MTEFPYPSATEDVVITLPNGETETRLANGLSREERTECERLERLYAAYVNGRVELSEDTVSGIAKTLRVFFDKLEDFKKSPEFRRNKARRARRRNR